MLQGTRSPSHPHARLGFGDSPLPKNFTNNKNKEIMAISKKLALKDAVKTIADIKDVTYNGAPAKKIILESGQAGYIRKDLYDKEMPTWPTADGTEEGDLQLPADYRLSQNGYWTNFQRSNGVGVEVSLPGE